MAHKILLVDDSKTVRQQVAVALIQAGFLTVEAGDGQEALDQMAKRYNFTVVDAGRPADAIFEELQRHIGALPFNGDRIGAAPPAPPKPKRRKRGWKSTS